MKLFIDPDLGGYRGYAALDAENDVTVSVTQVGLRFNIKVGIWRSDCDAIPSWAYDGHFVGLSKANGRSLCGWDNGTIERGEIRFLHVPHKPERLVVEDLRFDIEYVEKEGVNIFTAGV